MDPIVIDAACDRAMLSEFKWGSDDCSLWPCDIVRECTGVDLAKQFRGKYRTAKGAAHNLKRFSGGGLVETAIKIAALHSLKPVRFPWSGDLIGVVAGDHGPTLALFTDGRWLGRSEDGVAVLPANRGVIAWEVPKCHP